MVQTLFLECPAGVVRGMQSAKKMCTFATKKTTHPGVGVWPSIKTENPFVVEIELQHFRF